MSCNNCTRLKPINICADSIIIGTVDNPDEEYNVILTSLANGFKVRYKCDSDMDGLLTLTPDNGFSLATNMAYQLIVNQSNSLETGDDLTIGTITDDCYTLSFERITEILNTGQTPTNLTQTLELA